ncbi:MAG: glycosyltransferase [candidate division SR1 bacterium]|nr:glycosyltransferase [candidate division SR1 bacterium]
MKNIGIDISHYDTLSGYGIVTKNIIDRVVENKDYNFFLFSNREVKNKNMFENRDNIKIIITKGVNYLFYRFFFQIFLLKRHKIDILFTLDQYLPLIKVCKYICVIHDIEGRKKHHGIKKFFYNIKTYGIISIWPYFYSLNIDQLSNANADEIICPSEYTKENLIKYYFKNKEKHINVINRGIDHEQGSKIDDKENNYILFPFCHAFYDDFMDKLAKRILEKGLTKKIIFFKPSGKYFNLKESKQIDIIQKTISNKEKDELFSKAFLCIYISTGDGFGFTPLESMVHGIPIIFNDNSCLNEISGDGGLCLPRKIDTFLDRIEKLVENREYYTSIVEKGMKHIKKFKRDKTVSGIYRIFEHITKE